MERILFLTGRLAQHNLEKVLAGMEPPPFHWEVRELGLQVAGLMTADMIHRRLAQDEVIGFDRVMVPGRCRGDLDALSAHYGVPVERGPEELKDLPRHFNRAARAVDLSRYETRIFAEIVDAPRLEIDAVVARARELRACGADVIDIGCLPATPFPHLEDCVGALKAEGLMVSVDSLNPQELLRGGRAGADYLLSLTADSLWIADEVAFPSTMVDRIVPATTEDDRRRISASLGVEDAWPVVCERFSQWVIEDRFPTGRPAWERAGATFTDDVAPFELMKLRMLNGAHSALAYLGYLAGHETVAEASSDAVFAAFLDRLWREIMPAVPAPDVLTLVMSRQDALVMKYAAEQGARIDLALRSAADDNIEDIVTDPVTLSYIINTRNVTPPEKLPVALDPRIDMLNQLNTGTGSTAPVEEGAGS